MKGGGRGRRRELVGIYYKRIHYTRREASASLPARISARFLAENEICARRLLSPHFLSALLTPAAASGLFPSNVNTSSALRPHALRGQEVLKPAGRRHAGRLPRCGMHTGCGELSRDSRSRLSLPYAASTVVSLSLSLSLSRSLSVSFPRAVRARLQKRRDRARRGEETGGA